MSYGPGSHRGFVAPGSAMRGLWSIDPGSSEPLYRQLRVALADGLSAGLFPPGRPMPSSRELAALLDVSRNTVTVAYQELIALGRLESRPRSGLYPVVDGPQAPHSPTIDGLATQEPTSTRRDMWMRDDDGVDARLAEIRKDPEWHTKPYPFLAGQPDLDAFPTRAWGLALTEALEGSHRIASLADSIDRDDPLLVEQIVGEVLPGRGIDASPDEILITSGAQNALHLCAEHLFGAGTRVGVEDPGYNDAWHILARAGAELVPMQVDGDGARVPDTSELTGLCLTPSHHSPTNVTLSTSRRRHLLNTIGHTGAIVIEDDYDSEFRYRGSPSPALKAHDTSGNVIYLGSFSKFLAPGLRLGFVVADPELIRELRRRRRYALRHPSGHLQRATALFIASGEYHRNLRRLHQRLRRKWTTINELAHEVFPWFDTEPPPGGLSIWIPGPHNLDTTALAVEARTHGVLVEPGVTFFFAEPRPRNFLRLGFSAIRPDAIPAGMRLLGGLADEQLRLAN